MDEWYGVLGMVGHHSVISFCFGPPPTTQTTTFPSLAIAKEGRTPCLFMNHISLFFNLKKRKKLLST